MCAVACGCALAQLGYVRLGLWALALSVPCGIVPACVWTLWRRTRRPQQTSQRYALGLRLVGAYAPGLQSAAQSAVDLQLSHTGDLAGFSPELIEQHLRSTAARLFDVHLIGRWQNTHGYKVRWAFGCMLAALVLCVAVSLACSRGRERMWLSLQQPQAYQLSETTLIRDLSLHYSYPAYTHAPARTVPSSDGTIAAVEGTQVEIEVQAIRPVSRAWLELTHHQESGPTRLDAIDINGANARYRLPLLHEGNYRFAFDFGRGDALGEPELRAVHIVEDAAPTIVMSMPFFDITMRDNQPVDVQWRGEDDFNLQEVKLIVERAEQQQVSLDLWTRPKDTPVQTQADGRYSWNVAALGLEPGESVTFYVAGWDTDTNHGPKRGVSASHKLTLYSARAHHEELVSKCRAALDTLIDALGLELESPIARAADNDEAFSSAMVGIKQASERSDGVDDVLAALLHELAADAMAQPQIRVAFAHVAEHVHTIRVGRAQQKALVPKSTYAMRMQRLEPSARLQETYVKHLEQDIIYLDDLLAVARIDEIKSLAKDLLSDQRHLKDLLQQMGHTQDPNVKAQLQQGISALRQKMLDVLRKMSEIKQNLPGEYRNLEASSMLRLDDQLNRLDKQLREGDLGSAAEELEQLANMVENMVQSLGEAQKQYGGERYDAMRQQLQNFADEFRQLEDEQQSLSQRSDTLLEQVRQTTIAKMAKNKDDFVKKARQLAHDALSALDEVGHDKQLASRYDFEIEQARQALLDLDSLLIHQDFAEAHARAIGAEDDTTGLCARLSTQNALGQGPASLLQARKSCSRAAQKTEALASMLAQLFDDPETSLNPAQKQQMSAMEQKQRALKTQASQLNDKMQQMAEQMPLFGDDNQQRLGQAGALMQSAAEEFSEHALSKASTQSRQAAQSLGQLRQSLQKAAQQSGQGVPFPLGSAAGAPGEAGGSFDAEHQQEVAIPVAPNKPAGPSFRQDLMEAAKQKAPAYYEDAVRRYYNELIR
jgi:hypothetical protein